MQSPLILVLFYLIQRHFKSRIERLEAILEEHRRRESEETSSLERSMEQIESNLKLATVLSGYLCH